MSETLHLVEFGGRGGVFQHTLAVAEKLSGDGFTVVFHTATDPEFELPNVSFCKCVNWRRENRLFRNSRLLKDFIFQVIPHLIVATKNGSVWIQGMYRSEPYVQLCNVT